MSEKYIQQNKKSCTIVKSSKIYAKINNLNDAIVVRDFLVDNDWDLSKIPKILENNGDYLVLTVYDDKIYLLAKYRQKPDCNTVDKLVKKHKRNPNGSKYGLNISKIFDTFVIKKRIAGDDYIFGYYDNLEDASFVRNFLMDNSWNVNAFGEIEFDDDQNNYKLVKVIDDKAYIITSFENKEDIDITKALEEFLAEISKNKHGLANHPHLCELSDKLDDLEAEFNVKSKDDFWNLDSIKSDPLNDIIFNLTPFQKSVYDAIGDKTSFEDIKKSLIRYKSKNFENKINKNLDELIALNLIKKENDYYERV